MRKPSRIARDTAVKARSSAVITLKTLIVNAPAELREAFEPLTDRTLIECCAELESGDLVDPTASVKRALRSLATRWLTLAAEISAHDKALDSITRTAAPTLREAFGIGPDASAKMMIVAGDNPSRIRSDAAFAKLCGACPIPASSGVTNRHRLFRGGHRQANATLYRIVIVRMRWHQPTIDDVARRTAHGLSKKDSIRCLKRFVAREIYNALIDDHRLRAAHLDAASRAAAAVLTYRGVNAMAESFLATLECELLDRTSLSTHAAARAAIFEFIDGWYNTRRRHSALRYLSPLAFERRHAGPVDGVDVQIMT